VNARTCPMNAFSREPPISSFATRLICQALLPRESAIPILYRSVAHAPSAHFHADQPVTVSPAASCLWKRAVSRFISALSAYPSFLLLRKTKVFPIRSTLQSRFHELRNNPPTSASSEIPVIVTGTFCLFVIRKYMKLETGYKTYSVEDSSIAASAVMKSFDAESSFRKAESATALKRLASSVPQKRHVTRPIVTNMRHAAWRANRLRLAGSFLFRRRCLQ
jgi:hypothetical protein